MDLRVGDTRVVIEDGVNGRGAEARFRRTVALPGVSGRGLPVPVALLFPDNAASAAVGNVAKHRDIDLDQRPRMIVFVASQRLAPDPVDMGGQVHTLSDKHRMNAGGGMPRRAAIWAGPRRCRERNEMIFRFMHSVVRCGMWCGRLDRCVISAVPSVR